MSSFDPTDQVISILGPDGSTEIPVRLSELDGIYWNGMANEVNYGSQIGASFIMLLVIVTMTPNNKFARLPTLINIAALSFNVVRSVLLSLFFTSKWESLYVILTGDATSVPANDFNISVAATVLGIPTIILLEAVLAVQAWAMVKLWPSAIRWPVIAISAAVTTCAIGFRFATAVLQSEVILYNADFHEYMWVHIADLAIVTTSICWFCALFIIRLAIHMWTHHSILPPVKGLSAMEVLVMTNGVLMLIPVMFAAMEFGVWSRFESGSLTFTSVIVLLPLGTLVAQRVSNPSAFSHDGSSGRNTSASKQSFLRSWQSSSVDPKEKDMPAAGVTSRIAAGREKNGSIDAELARIDADDLEHGVRVDHHIEHREERLNRGLS